MNTPTKQRRRNQQGVEAATVAQMRFIFLYARKAKETVESTDTPSVYGPTIYGSMVRASESISAQDNFLAATDLHRGWFRWVCGVERWS